MQLPPVITTTRSEGTKGKKSTKIFHGKKISSLFVFAAYYEEAMLAFMPFLVTVPSH